MPGLGGLEPAGGCSWRLLLPWPPHPTHTLPIPLPGVLPAAETKIQELAGIVKLLRRGMGLMQTKAGEFIAAACKFEKEVGQQVRAGGDRRHGCWLLEFGDVAAVSCRSTPMQQACGHGF